MAVFSRGNQQKAVKYHVLKNRLLRLLREAEEDWAAEIVVSCAQKNSNHTQRQNRRAARERQRGKSRAHIR
jgi:hypothetical protein